MRGFFVVKFWIFEFGNNISNLFETLSIEKKLGGLS
jgi:hypothetical protein